MRRTASLAGRAVSFDGLKVHWSVAPCMAVAPKRPVLLISGWGGVGDDWGGVVRRLSVRRSVVVYDQRGLGASSTPDAPDGYRIADLAEDARAVMREAWEDARGGDEDAAFGYDVVGFSLGGLVAQELALRQPSEVTSLVLASTAAHLGVAACAEEHVSRDYFDVLDGWDEGVTTVAEASRRRCAAAFIVHGLPRLWVEKHVDILKLADRFVDADKSGRRPLLGLSGQKAALLRSAARAPGELAAIACPTLILHGDVDPIVDVHAATALAHDIPKAQLIFLAGVGHHAWIQEPAEWVGCINRFLDGDDGEDEDDDQVPSLDVE